MLGERICLLRRRQGWSQAELARRLCVSPSAVGMYEQGRREPSLEAVVALSHAFCVSTDFLLTGKPLTEGDRRALHQAVAVGAAGFTSAGLSAEERAALLAALMNEA